MKYILFLQVWCLLPVIVLSQSLQHGMPLIQNYTPNEYNGHVQNWGFTEDDSGVLYVANLQNVLRYDGVNWFSIPVKNENVYSIHRAQNGKIYVGGVNEFGYLDEPEDSSNAIVQYYSLRHLVPDSIQIDRIFDIASKGDEIYFQSNGSLIRYNGESANYFIPKIRFASVFNINGEIIVREALDGLKRVDGDSLILIEDGDYFGELNLTDYLNHPERDLFCQYNKCTAFRNGAFIPLEMEAESYFSAYHLDEGVVLQDGTIAIATRAGGVLHMDVDGNILNKFTKETGLISNTVYGIYEDRNGSVWAATVEGLSRIDFSIPIRLFDERVGLTESVLDIAGHQDEVLFSSSDGVFHYNRSDTLLNYYETNSSCYQVLPVEGYIYSTCSEKLHVLETQGYRQIFEPPVHKVAQYNRPNIFVMGSERKFYVVQISGSQVEVLYEIDDISANPVSISVDNQDNIWIGTAILGLVKLNLKWKGDEVVGHTKKVYFSNLINPSDDKRVGISQIESKPAFLTWGKGIQQYNYETGNMEQITKFGSVFSDTTRQYFQAEEDAEGNVWFRSNGAYQAAKIQENGNYTTYEGPLKLIDHNQSNDIYAGDADYIWYGTERGAVRYSKNHTFNHLNSFQTQINEVLVRNDSLINGGKRSKPTVLDYKDNELRFTYAAASYYAPSETEYRVKLKGFDDEWTVWNRESHKDYTNIPEGEYTFQVQAMNIFGVLSESETFSFSVLPPWYRTGWAYLLYLLTVLGIFYSIYKIRINQIMKVQRIRNNIASDLHDEVSATLSSISYFAQAIESDRVKGDKNRFVKLISNSATDAKEKITDIVWAINPEHDDWQNFLSKCRRYASDLLESKDINYSLKIDEYIPGKLDMQFRQHLWLIYKEMVTNAVRHSGAKNLDVILKYQDGALQLVVQDDGNGMDVDKVRKGNGLVNIQKRADLIDADINLKTSEGFGTRWKLRVAI